MIIRETVGLVAAPYTGFYETGEINVETIKSYALKLKNNGLIGAFILGSTGEGVSLSVEERMILAEEWVKHQENGFKIIVHVAANSIKDASRLASHAEEIGAAAIASTGPSYYKPDSPATLVSFMKEVASNAPKTPFYYYHIPGLNQNHISAYEFMKIALKEIPSLAGIKYTYEDEMEFKLCASLADGKLDSLYGRDETLMCGLALGAKGGVGSTYNFMPGVYLKIMELFDLGHVTEANEWQLKSMKVIEYYSKYRGIPAGKAIMRHFGIDLGPCRLPVVSLSKQEEENLIGALTDLELFALGLK